MVYQENPVFGQSLRNSAVAKGVETPFCPPQTILARVSRRRRQRRFFRPSVGTGPETCRVPAKMHVFRGYRSKAGTGTHTEPLERASLPRVAEGRSPERKKPGRVVSIGLPKSGSGLLSHLVGQYHRRW